MKVAIIGANGQLGCDVVRAFSDNCDDIVAITHSDLEISDYRSVLAKVREVAPDLIVNTAAMHQVENCEQDPDRAFRINAVGARNVALAAQEARAALMHVSTDYVFDGAKRRAYEEEDTPRPVNTYGNSKLAGEYFVRSIAERHFVLRTSGLYGESPCRGKGGLNFVERMLKVGKERGVVRVVANEEITPTWTYELARQMVILSNTTYFGLIHATAEGSCTWYEFAKAIFATSNMKVDVEAARALEFPSKTPRPAFSVLENRVLKKHEINEFRNWQDGLRCYLERSGATVLDRQTSAAANG